MTSLFIKYEDDGPRIWDRKVWKRGEYRFGYPTPVLFGTHWWIVTPVIDTNDVSMFQRTDGLLRERKLWNEVWRDVKMQRLA